MPADEPHVSVVMPAHNAAATLGRQLESLAAQQTSLSFEVLVVDNASTDATAAVAASYAERLPGLRVVTARDGAGPGYARNAGVRETRADLLLFCDADDEVRPDWVDRLTKALEDADLVGGSADVTRINDARTLAGVFTPDADRLPTAMGYLPYAIGCNMAMHRATWDLVHGFDESYLGGHEEVDLSWRVQEAGGTLAFAPDAVVDYRMRGSLRRSVLQRFRYGRSYAQLYAHFRHAPIERGSLRREAGFAARLLASAPRNLLTGNGSFWLTAAAWTLGRWRGWLAYGVRPPI